MLLIPILIAFLLSIFHFFFETYAKHLKRYDINLISFSSGLFVTYIFLSMLPEIFKGTAFIGNSIFLFTFWGFVTFHIAEKYIFQHVENTRRRLKDLIFLRTSGFFINHFILGVALVLLFKFGQSMLGYISIIPILFHTISSSLVIEHLHKSVRETGFGKLVSSGSIFFGAIIGWAFNLPQVFYFAAFSFITGMLLYIIVRDTIPKEKLGKPIYFLSGVILFLATLIIESIAV